MGAVLCACGCGKPAAIAKATRPQFGHVKGQPTKYARGHNARSSSSQVWYFDGDRCFVRDRQGRKHYWYRIVMWDKLGRELRPDEDVHHINGDKTDDRPENLTILSRSEHLKLHFAQGDNDEMLRRFVEAGRRANAERKKQVALECATCGTTFERALAKSAPGKFGVHFCSSRCHYDFRAGRQRSAA